MKLHKWQKKQGLTNEQLAKACKVHWTTIYGWFNGTRFPSRKKAMFVSEEVTGGAVSFKEAMFPKSN